MMLKIFEKGKQRATVGYEDGVYTVCVYTAGVHQGTYTHQERNAAMASGHAWIALP